jgi:CRP/FNR family cyclic AMP-dependent transcriptional regulator
MTIEEIFIRIAPGNPPFFSTIPMSKLKAMIANSSWASGLTPEQLLRVQTETISRRVPKGGFICRKGENVDYWLGLVDGLGKMTNTSPSGKVTTFTGVTSGSWFGEGSLLKIEPRRYDAMALRDCELACMPRATFMWLLDNSIPFNRFLLLQLNERLGQFIGMVEYDRLLGPDGRVAHCLASLYNAMLSPGMQPLLGISQEEVAQLSGLSRQRANQSLKLLEAAALLRVGYGGITILNLDGLRQFED